MVPRYPKRISGCLLDRITITVPRVDSNRFSEARQGSARAITDLAEEG